MTTPGPGSVENTAAILRNICGRTAEGNSSACPHDHIGEASGLTAQIKIGHLRELAETTAVNFPDSVTEWFADEADRMEQELMG